jgi:hypothetical protein
MRPIQILVAVAMIVMGLAALSVAHQWPGTAGGLVTLAGDYSQAARRGRAALPHVTVTVAPASTTAGPPTPR